MHTPPSDKKREMFSEQNWGYVEFESGLCMLTRRETTSRIQRLFRRLLGEEPISIESEISILYDLVIGGSEPPEGSYKDTFILYRNGTQVGKVDNTMLPPIILQRLRDEAISHAEIRQKQRDAGPVDQSSG